jgi:hypothetical protein
MPLIPLLSRPSSILVNMTDLLALFTGDLCTDD